MNTTQRPVPSSAVDQADRPSRSRRRIAHVLATLAAVAAALVGVTATAMLAHAATSVSGCFRSATPGMSIAGVGVQLQAYGTGGWFTIWSGSLPQSQCVSVSTPYHSSYYLRYAVNYTRFGATWYGTSPYNATPGYGAVNVGTGIVRCAGCYI